MKDVILDINKIKNPHSGLGQFCLHLSDALLTLNENLSFGFYNSNHKRYREMSYQAKSLHRVFPRFLPKSRVWHAIHQEAPYIPNHGKLVLTIHDMNYMYKDRPDFLKRSFLRQLGKKIRQADHITFISQFSKKAALHYFDIPEKKISVIYNGVTFVEKITPPPLLLPEKFFMTIGHVLRKKNFHVLVDLMELREEALIIVGDYQGTYGEMIRRRIKEKKLDHRIFLLGKVSDEEKGWLMENCQAFLFPSLFEGFGIPVIESMLRGRPTFSSRKTSLPEICGDHAYYFDSFDPHKMAGVLEQGLRDFNPSRGKAMMEWAKQYRWEKAARSYLDIYNHLLS